MCLGIFSLFSILRECLGRGVYCMCCVFACISKVHKYLDDINNEGSYIGVKVEFFITKSCGLCVQ
jgi:hypothetical protein